MRRTCVAALLCLMIVPLKSALAADDWVERVQYIPAGRRAHGMAYISPGKILLFGGDDDSEYINDTWVYDLITDEWTAQSPVTQPTARGHFGMAYVGGDQVLLFGGEDNAYNYLGDTWVYDLSDNTWIQMFPSSSPTARYSLGMAYIGDDHVLLFGGEDDTDLCDDTWVYDLSENTWTQLSSAPSPTARGDQGMAYLGDDRVLLFGGWDSVDLGDTWVYDLSGLQWTQISPASSPTARYCPGMAYIGSNEVVLFGGANSGGDQDDTWVYDLAASTWSQDTNATQPLARSRMGFAETSLDGSTVCVMFSGDAIIIGGGYPDDTWFFGGGDYVAVELSSFIADPEDGRVSLWWATESEQENLGFHVYRAESRNGHYEQLTRDLIPGAGTSATRNEYNFTDDAVTNGVTYWYKLEDIAYDGTSTMHAPISATPGKGLTVKPDAEILTLAYPNPMETETSISYQLNQSNRVKLGIYDISGHEIRVLEEGIREPGQYTVTWDGKDDNRRSVASGVYVYRFEAGDDISQIGKAVLLR